MSKYTLSRAEIHKREQEQKRRTGNSSGTAAKPAAIRSGMSEDDIRIREEYNKKLGEQTKSSRPKTTTPAIPSTKGSGSIPANSTNNGGTGQSLGSGSAAGTSSPGRSRYGGNTVGASTNYSAGTGGYGATGLSGVSIPVGKQIIGAAGTNTSFNTRNSNSFNAIGEGMRKLRNVSAGAAGQLPAAAGTAGTPYYDPTATAAGVVGTVPLQPKAKNTNTGGTGMPRIASGMSDYDIDLRQDYITEQEREDYLISLWPHGDKMSDYDISVRQNYIKDTPALTPVFLNNISPTFAANNAKKQNYFDSLDPQPGTKHEQKGADFSSGALPYFMHQNMPGGDVLGKLSTYESGKTIYPKLAAALTPSTVSEPRETTIVQTELNNAQDRLAAKQQEIEDFYMQNRLFLNAEGLFGSATDRHVSEVKGQQEILRIELRDLEERISLLKDELFRARQTDWGRIAQNEDFEEYAQIGAAIQNPTWEDVNDPENIDPLASPEERGKQVGNIVTFSMDNKGHLEYATKRDVGNAAYTYMTDEEVRIYNYLLGKYDKDTAQIYLDSLENTLNYRYGADVAKQYTDIENPFWRTVASMPYGFAAGVDQFASGINQLFHEEEQPVTPMQYASQTIQQNLGSAGQIAYGVSNVVGNMLPGMLVGKSLGVLGSTLGMGAKGAGIVASAGGSAALGASAAGNAYTQALQEGYSKQQAKTYAALVGVSEAGLTYLLNGVGKMQGVGEKALLSKVQALDSTFAKMALTGVIKVGGEVLEEELQLQLEPLFRTMIFDEDYEAPTGKEMLETAVIAALTNGVVEGPAIAGVQVDFGKLGELVMQNTAGRETVVEALKGNRPGGTAGELAQSLVEQATTGQPLSKEDIGKLYTITQVDTQTGKTVKSEGKVTELFESALELPADSQAHQLAAELSERLDTALTELGMDIGELYQMSRADQLQLIEQVTDKVLNDQTIGELARLAEKESVDARDQYHKIFSRGTSKLQQGISAFSPGDPLYENVKAVKPDGDKFDVAMHGAPTAVAFGGRESNMSPRTLAAVIRHSEGYHGQEIRLLACSTGVQNDGNYCFAEELANALGVTVWAPNDVLYIAANGTTYVGLHGDGTFLPYEPNQRRRMK